MLTAVCQELRNWFATEKHFGDFTISEGALDVDFLQENQYFRIVGSVFNDGVHQYPDDELDDETFSGAVWAMAVPDDVIQLANDIKTFQQASGSDSPYVSESWGGYSYTKATNADGTVAGWREAFADRLNRWRKIL